MLGQVPTPRLRERKEMAPQEIDIIQSETGNGTRPGRAPQARLSVDPLAAHAAHKLALPLKLRIPARHRKRRSSLARGGQTAREEFRGGFDPECKAEAARRSQPPGALILSPEQLQNELRALVRNRQRLDAQLLLRLERLQLG
jgi:hypothetical protein